MNKTDSLSSQQNLVEKKMIESSFSIRVLTRGFFYLTGPQNWTELNAHWVKVSSCLITVEQMKSCHRESIWKDVLK